MYVVFKVQRERGKQEKICEIENKLTMIEKKYPEAAQQSTDGAMSVPAGNDTTTPPDDGSMQKSDDGSMQKFPTFEGKDLDGKSGGGRKNHCKSSKSKSLIFRGAGE